MAEQSYPHPGVDTTEDQFTRMFGQLRASGVAAAPGSAALQVSAGTGLQVLVAAGSAFVRGLFYRLPSADAPLALAVTPPDTLTRYDLAVLLLDPAADTIRLEVLDGVPGAGVPVVPPQTEVGEYALRLASWPVAPGATGPGTITDLRTFAGTNGPGWTSTSRPNPGDLGVIGYNSTTGRHEYWDGSTYKPVVDQAALAIAAAQITNPEALNVGRINGVRITVGPTAPSSPAINDLYVPGF